MNSPLNSYVENLLDDASRVMDEALDGVPLDLRVAVLCTLIASEICTLPHSYRQAALLKVITDLPGFLDASERDLREWLAERARSGRG